MNVRFAGVFSGTLWAAFFLSGCGAIKKTVGPKEEVVVAMEDIDVKAPTRAAERYQPAAERVWDLLNTELKLRFNIPERQALGTARLQLKPFAYPQDSLILDAQSMDIKSVRNNSLQVNNPLQYRYQEDKLFINLQRRHLPTDTLDIIIDYVAKPYENQTGGSAAIREERGLYFVNAAGKIPEKPLQIWTQGEPEANSHWFPTIDKPNERSRFRFEITVPDSLMVLSNGIKTSEKTNPATRDKTVVWEMKDPMPPYLAMMAIGKYNRITDGSVNGIPVDYYLEPKYAPYAKSIFPNTPEMIRFFSDYTGVNFPWSKYSQVVARDYVSGAMENTSASLFGEFVNGDDRERKDQSYEGIVAHELFHQWFGDLVTAKSWSNLTVNESFATLGEMLWNEHKYGADERDVSRYNNLQRYVNGAERKDPALVRHYYAHEGEMFDHISYQKGSLILYYVREIAGEEKFREAMKYFLTKHAHSAADALDWKKALEEVTGKDWNPFFNQWYFRGGHPKITFTYNTDSSTGRTALIATQEGTRFTLPIVTAAIDETGMIRRYPWTIENETDTLYISHSGNSKPLIIPDEKYLIVGELKDTKTETEWIRQLNLADGYFPRLQALNKLRNADFNKSLWTGYEEIARSGNTKLREYALVLLQDKQGAWRQQPGFIPFLKNTVENRMEAPTVRNEALQLYTKWDTGKQLVGWLTPLLEDESYLVGGSALSAIATRDSTIGLQMARTILDKGNGRSAVLRSALLIVSKTALPEDLKRIENNASGKWGSEKPPFLQAAINYWLKSPDHQPKALSLLDKWYQEEEAGFVKERQIGFWEEMAVRVQERAKDPTWLTKKDALITFLDQTANTETNSKLKDKIQRMQERVSGKGTAE